ncbi:pentapeptide repeat-containing protein [Dactylosporangium sp. AC04546]|uniref:pentapeptide repeat-containing protein n=1 Tax=Dactylosporangium sp. AC04546 TaxID=2862460 RepID=UPI001EE10E16|nr:pentapeptide repeat-containing protein [Dactylosporangium sp. AC04546]WVK88589.1 pentapeptide repeat-containing protein [Dactylosporangium sp. AC04546]
MDLVTLVEQAEADPARRQSAADAVCAAGPDALPLLTARLRAGWEGISVDLSGATLVDADFSGCHLAAAAFADTRFHGTTRFDHATFDGGATFQRALFTGDASFVGVRFDGYAAFGRTRFRGRAGFAGARFGGMAWFGRGAETWWDDDEAWDTVEQIDPAPWDEPNEADPDWPVAVLIEDYQDWEEGGDGARFTGDVTFGDATFAGPAWFYNARFAAAATFAGAHFAGRCHLDHPTADLTGAHWTGNTEDGASGWPLGWTAPPEGGDVTFDPGVPPFARHLTEADPSGLAMLVRLGEDRPDLRQRIVTTLCALLRAPLVTDVRADLPLRRATQATLTERLREWPGLHVHLSGAVLIDADFTGCEADYAEFCGAQFHGTTRFEGNRMKRRSFSLDGPRGHATFHGDAVFGTPPPDHAVFLGAVT